MNMCFEICGDVSEFSNYIFQRRKTIQKPDTLQQLEAFTAKCRRTPYNIKQTMSKTPTKERQMRCSLSIFSPSLSALSRFFSEFEGSAPKPFHLSQSPLTSTLVCCFQISLAISASSSALTFSFLSIIFSLLSSSSSSSELMLSSDSPSALLLRACDWKLCFIIFLLRSVIKLE